MASDVGTLPFPRAFPGLCWLFQVDKKEFEHDPSVHKPDQRFAVYKDIRFSSSSAGIFFNVYARLASICA
jgi:hypothetical protein